MTRAAAQAGEGCAGGGEVDRRRGEVDRRSAAQLSPARRRSRSRGGAGGCATERGGGAQADVEAEAAITGVERHETRRPEAAETRSCGVERGREGEKESAGGEGEK